MIDPQTAHYLKARIAALRQICRSEKIPLADIKQAEAEFREELIPLGLVIMWIDEVGDYGIFSNEHAEK